MTGESENALEVQGGRELRQLWAGFRGVTKLASVRSRPEICGNLRYPED